MSLRSPLTRRSARARVLAAAGAFAVLTTGCGVAETGIRPGVAAQVEDQTIRVDEVDDVANRLCRVLQSSTQFPREGLTDAQLRNAALRGLSLHAIGQELLEEYDATLPEGQDRGEEQLRLSFGAADPADRAAVEPVFTSDQYIQDVLVAIGTEEGGSAADPQAALQAGVARAQEWQERADVVTNPAFEAVEFGSTAIESARSELSVPASEFATGAAAGDQAWAASLPESQRCTGKG